MFAIIYCAFLNGNEMSSPDYYPSTFIIAFSFFCIGVKIMNKKKLKNNLFYLYLEHHNDRLLLEITVFLQRKNNFFLHFFLL